MSETVMLRTSERNLFKQCQWKWAREYLDRLKPKQQDSVALWFGTGIHLALEHYYITGTKRGADPVETWNNYVDETSGNTTYINAEHGGDSSFAVEAKELGAAMLRSYLDLYGDEEWMDVIATEFPFQVGVKYDERFSDRTERNVGVYVGTMDLVYRDTRDGKVYVMDHKTAKQLGSGNTQYLRLDDQAGAYYAVAATVLREKGLIGPKETISGIVYNYLVKAMPDTRPQNAEGYYTNKPKKDHYLQQLPEHGIEVDAKMTVKKLEALAEEAGITVYGDVSATQPPKRFDRKVVLRNARQQRRQIQRMSEDLSAMSAVRNGVQPVTKAPSRNCTFCPFVDLCEIDEDGGDYSDMAEQLFTTWDPYEAHRKEEA